jgi:hypothetical protein
MEYSRIGTVVGVTFVIIVLLATDSVGIRLAKKLRRSSQSRGETP